LSKQKKKIILDKNKININEDKKIYFNDKKKVENKSIREKKKIFFRDNDSQTYVNSVLDKIFSL
jgi:hypothetical protein